MLNLLFQIVFLLIIVFGLVMIVKDNKLINRKRKEEMKNRITKKDKRVAYIIIFATIIGYYILSYILDLDILNFIIFRKNGSTFSFIGLILVIVTSLIIGFVYEKIKNKKINNNAMKGENK